MPATLPSTARKLLEELFLNFKKRADESPHAGSLKLNIASKPCGIVISKAAQALNGLSGVEISQEFVSIGSSLKPGPELDALLENVAKTLRSAGCTPGWRDELLDIWVNPETQDVRLGAIERGAMRPLGLATRAVHLNAWSSRGDIWVARRSLTKKTDPGLWDTLVGGLVGYKEPDDLALIRESAEEAGLQEHHIASRTPMHTIHWMRRRIPEGYQNEQVITCECVLPDDVTPINQDGESMEIRCLSPEVVVDMIRSDLFTIEASIVLVEDLLRRSKSA